MKKGIAIEYSPSYNQIYLSNKVRHRNIIAFIKQILLIYSNDEMTLFLLLHIDKYGLLITYHFQVIVDIIYSRNNYFR